MGEGHPSPTYTGSALTLELKGRRPAFFLSADSLCRWGACIAKDHFWREAKV